MLEPEEVIPKVSNPHPDGGFGKVSWMQLGRAAKLASNDTPQKVLHVEVRESRPAIIYRRGGVLYRHGLMRTNGVKRWSRMLRGDVVESFGYQHGR